MRFIATLHATPAAARRADAAHDAFAARHGGADSWAAEGVRLSTAGAATPGSGVVEDAGTRTVAPYRLVLEDGTPGRLRTEAGRAAVARALSDGAEGLVAPFCAVRAGPRRLAAVTDFCGHARIFVHRGPEMAIVTNCIASAQATLGRALDEEAVLAFAAGGYLPDDRTFHAGLRQMRPMERLTLEAAPEGLVARSVLAPWPALDRPDPDAEPRAARVLSGIARSLAGATEGPITLGLSGGRDSRLMAAVFLHAGAEVDLYTMDKFAEETAVARDLAARLGPRAPHRVTEVPTNAAGELFDPFESARVLVEHHAGMQESGMVGRADPAGLRTPFLGDGAVQVSGAAGELLHGQLYPKRRGTREVDLGKLDMDRAAAIASIPKRVVQKGGISRAAIRVFARALTAKLSEAPPLIDGMRILDWYYLHHKQRRWSSSASNNRVVAPMVAPGFAFAALTMPTADIARSIVPRRLTEALVPEWAGVPYVTGQAGLTARRPRVSQGVADAVLERAEGHDLLRHAFDLDDLRGIAGARWDETRPDLRDALFKRVLWLCEVIDQFG